MKSLLSLLALAGALSMGMAHATSPAQAAQQGKMKACNAQAKTDALKGDARKTFMKECLSKHGDTQAAAAAPASAAAKPATAAPAVAASAPTQQSKMKTCNTEATTKALSGEARKTFMSTCLKD